MRILLVGSGGREHALAWKIRQSPHVTTVFCAPGNPGIEELAELVPIKQNDITALCSFARDNRVDLTVVGPEQPLTEGIVDVFQSSGLTIFGPTKTASELEGSKVFAKQFMQRHAIPTANFRTFTAAERFDAERYVNEVPVPIVLKADGLAAGKGVTICETKEQALAVLDAMVEQRVFGEAGSNLVIEDFLVGEEASVFAISDGKEFVVLPPAQDHKRLLDNDQGKNTGGMGAYAPTPIITPELLTTIERTIIRPTILGMAKERRPYRGCLYVGLMITETGPKVVEYNCRFGDPETQVVLPLIETDIIPLLTEASNGKLTSTRIKLRPHAAVCVVIASGGYPDRYDVGKPIVGLDVAAAMPDVLLFHAGTKREKGFVVTAGGRVLGVSAIGPQDDLEGTINRAYRAVERITFDGAYYRSDIGLKGVKHMNERQKGSRSI
jgi:phosphoribosylamine--glycine ligase